MGVAGPLTAPARKKRKRKPKPQSHNTHADKVHLGILKKKKWKKGLPKPLKPTTPPGAYKRSPITIDSDNETDPVISLDTSTSAAERAYSLPAVRSFDAKVYDERLVSGESSAPGTRQLPAEQRSLSPTSSYPGDGIKLTLADIHDFTLRQKTAQLMAVAPGLPVADLYHLLMDKRGYFEAAKQHVLHQSQSPLVSLPLRAATAPSIAPSRVLEIKEEPYIKIDLDDPDFIFDNDAPPPEHGKQSRPKQTARQPAARNHNLKETRHSTPTFTSKINVNRGMRATSYDLEFIVPDDEVFDDTDETYSDSDDSDANDVDMIEDETDLSIDMTPEYSYNSAILTSPSAG